MKRLPATLWLNLLPLVLMLVPFLAAAGFGLYVLHERGWLLDWLLVGALFGVAGWALSAWLRHRLTRRAAPLPDEHAPPPPPNDADDIDPRWNATERRAWQAVQALGHDVASQPPEDWPAVAECAEKVVVCVATTLHPDNPYAAARFTLPEVLLAVERMARDLREQAERRVPLSDAVRVSDVLNINALVTRYGSAARAAHAAYRLLRVGVNPWQALFSELRDQLGGAGIDAGWQAMKGELARTLVAEVGRYAIDLYGGRLRIDGERLVAAAQAAAPQPQSAPPVRVAIAGQLKAGKSSLVNALMGAVHAPVSALPGPDGVTEHRLVANDRPDLVLLDCPGLDGTASRQAQVLDTIARADLVLWVCAANQPAREADRAALTAWHATHPPGSAPAQPLIAVLTQVDLLPPVRQWSPPYNLIDPATPKARSIAGALDALSTTLPLADAPCVPLCLRNTRHPDNLETLWALMGERLEQAQQRSLARALAEWSPIDWRRTMSQCLQGGRYLGGLAWRAWCRRRDTPSEPSPPAQPGG